MYCPLEARRGMHIDDNDECLLKQWLYGNA